KIIPSVLADNPDISASLQQDAARISRQEHQLPLGCKCPFFAADLDHDQHGRTLPGPVPRFRNVVAGAFSTLSDRVPVDSSKSMALRAPIVNGGGGSFCALPSGARQKQSNSTLRNIAATR